MSSAGELFFVVQIREGLLADQLSNYSGPDPGLELAHLKIYIICI